MNEDMPAIAAIKEAILDQIIDPTHNHGSFVQLMAAREYGKAVMVADRTNQTFFGHLVRWRELLYLRHQDESEEELDR